MGSCIYESHGIHLVRFPLHLPNNAAPPLFVLHALSLTLIFRLVNNLNIRYGDRPAPVLRAISNRGKCFA